MEREPSGRLDPKLGVGEIHQGRGQDDSTHNIPGDTCNCQDRETAWQMTPERAGDGGAAPRLCRPGYALAASRPSAKRSLLPPGTGTWTGSSLRGELEPGGSADTTRCAPRGAAPPLGVPPVLREGPPEASPQPAGDPRRQARKESRGTGWGPPGLGDLPRAARGASRTPARASRRARAGGAGGRRAAMVAGLRCCSSRCPAASAHHPTRAPSRGRTSRPEGFPAAGSQFRTPRAAPAPPTS